MKKPISQILFPDKCVVCHEILGNKDERLMCLKCQGYIQPLTEPRCKRCSKSLGKLEQEYCRDCQKQNFLVERGIALYPYNEWMQRAVANFKYRGELAGGDYFANELAKNCGDWIYSIAPDVLIPVPIHKRRMRFRGFNQADYLAQKLGELLRIEVSKDYLMRTVDTKPQKGLDVKARTENLQKGFCVASKGRGYKRVLLVDDIYTTGATLEACAMALKREGTEGVYFLCLCIGCGDED